MKNRVWIKAGDLVLISIREDLDEGKGDVILKYTNDEYKDLKKEGEIPETLKLDDEIGYASDDEIEFQEADKKDDKKTNLFPDRDDDEEEKKDEVDIDAL